MIDDAPTPMLRCSRLATPGNAFPFPSHLTHIEHVYIIS
jgi:hypothetical protein